MSSTPARVLSNLALPSPAGVAIRAFHDYLPPGIRPSGPHPEFARRTLKDILSLIPSAERPDALIMASPEYLPIPADLVSFPGAKILLITDWNVCLRFLPDLCRLFDFCFTDWPGYRWLRRAGIANVFHQPLFGHDPAVFRPLGTGRNLDVSFCGNLNAGLHGERNRLLARVARWAGPRPVHLRQAFDGAYVDVLNRSRLVFNYSIRGEANMRLYEAMACGAAPLVEASNQEVPILFQEGEHYFRYHPDRLEARLDELLSDPARLAAAGEAARSAVARHTKADQIKSLLDFAGRESPRNPNVTPGAASAKALSKMRLLGSNYTLYEAIGEIQALAPVLPGFDAETLPATLLTLMEGAPEPLPSAEAFVEHLLSDGRQPAIIAAFLRLRLEARRGRWEAVLSLAETCLRNLDSLRDLPGETPAARIERLRDLYSRYYPPINLGKGFNADINQAFREDVGGPGTAMPGTAMPGTAMPGTAMPGTAMPGTAMPGTAMPRTAEPEEAGPGTAMPGTAMPGTAEPEEAGPEEVHRSAFARLLRAHCIEAQTRALCALGRPGEALARAQSLPEEELASVDVRATRARAAEAAGDSLRARREWEGAFAERPLDPEAWDKLAEALMRVGDRQALLAFLADILVLARAFLPAEQAERVRERLDQERR